ncbi:peptide ABC transporter substrate-binding protein [Alkalicaulis satelles]|uniref:Peptide ABC transporter substrate-binding protein n=1 Tax=Alkalicaulis satelles TaxID=2609175 RepID=A0A5M6ZH07_9PROT|nr:peptide ABC transporter substrate-binding protein [Alkalicaulis satelles]KAA5804053.1 peptide ABC transporter substrate-binding protein [Alkalicaulis satelles]
MIRWTCSAALAALCLTLAACGQPARDDGAVLHRGNSIEPGTLDPHRALISNEQAILYDLFLGLAQPGPDGRPIPGLAERWTVSEDGLEWVFHLREANWSDGQPITADDVVGSLRRTLDAETLNPFPALLFSIENAAQVNAGEAPPEALGAEALDERTVRLTLAYPAPYLLDVLMQSTAVPVPLHVIAAHGERWTRPENMVVSGPYKLAAWRSFEHIRLVRNEAFHEADEACIDTVYYYPTADAAAAERRVRNGELDLNADYLASNEAFLRRQAPELVQSVPGRVLRMITLNAARAPFDDIRARQAVAMAIDTGFIADQVLAGADAAAVQFMPDDVPGRTGPARMAFADDPMAARRIAARGLLAEAGYGPDNPLRLTFSHQPAAGWPRLAPVIQADLAAIAPWVTVTIETADTPIHYAQMQAGDFDIASDGWAPYFDDAYGYLMVTESAAGEYNYSRWTDPEFDALLARSHFELDPDARGALLAEAEQMLLDSAHYIPIFFENQRALVSPRVEGWIAHARVINPTRWLCVGEG